MKKITLIPNPNKDAGLDRTTSLCREIRKIWGGVIAVPCAVEGIFPEAERRMVSFLSPETLFLDTELIVVLGGDGTIIHAAAAALDANPSCAAPILGLNMGRIGYLADGSFADVLSLINKTEIPIEERLLLEANYENARYLALNDIVLSRSGASNIVEFRVLCDGEPLGDYRADGLIIATPTGSTAYSLSAGGPIIDPDLRSIAVTPICAHTITARPIILSPERKIEVQNLSEKEICLNVDGAAVGAIGKSDSVKITVSGRTARFVLIKKSGFAAKIREKLS